MELSELISAFAEENIPAKDVKEASQFLNTNDLLREFQNFSGMKFPQEDFVNAMKKAGFIFHYIEDKFYWLIK